MSGNEVQQMMFGNAGDDILFNLGDIQQYTLKYIERYRDIPSLGSIESLQTVNELLDKALLCIKTASTEGER